MGTAVEPFSIGDVAMWQRMRNVMERQMERERVIHPVELQLLFVNTIDAYDMSAAALHLGNFHHRGIHTHIAHSFPSIFRSGVFAWKVSVRYDAPYFLPFTYFVIANTLPPPSSSSARAGRTPFPKLAELCISKTLWAHEYHRRDLCAFAQKLDRKCDLCVY